MNEIREERKQVFVLIFPGHHLTCSQIAVRANYRTGLAQAHFGPIINNRWVFLPKLEFRTQSKSFLFVLGFIQKAIHVVVV